MQDAAPSPPLLTPAVLQKLAAARERGEERLTLSLDLGRSMSTVVLDRDGWSWQRGRYPWPGELAERTIYGWTGSGFEPVSRFEGGLYKLVPTEWGPPTFEISGIKMLPTAKLSPFEDAQRKVALVAPRGKRVLDCCGGLGYFAHWCLVEQAAAVLSFEKNPAVLWLRSANPWSPRADPRLCLRQADVAEEIGKLPNRAFEAVLHDPPRFSIAGDLYSLSFYEQLARVIVPGGLLFHYTGAPGKVSRGRDLAKEVKRRLARAGFEAGIAGDGLIAVRRARRSPRARPRTVRKARR